MALTKFRASPLPNPPADYDAQYIRQLIRVLENYFSQLDSNTPNYAQSYTADNFYGSGIGISVPYNQFYSMVDQTAGAIDQAYAVELESTSFTGGIYIGGANDTQITFSAPGIYTITYSLAFKNTTNDLQEIDVWFRYNDGTGAVDVPDSNSKFAISPRKSTGTPSYLIATTPFTGYASAPDVYVEIMWRVSNVDVSMEHINAVTYSAGVTPAIPATPSAIVQANFVSKPV
jgi:hypothetical protein